MNSSKLVDLTMSNLNYHPFEMYSSLEDGIPNISQWSFLEYKKNEQTTSDFAVAVAGSHAGAGIKLNTNHLTYIALDHVE